MNAEFTANGHRPEVVAQSTAGMASAASTTESIELKGINQLLKIFD